MIDLKSKTAILILIILNIMGIVINLPIETGTPSSYFNFIFSLFYLLVWIGLGIYFYTKKELIIYIYVGILGNGDGCIYRRFNNYQVKCPSCSCTF